MGVGEGIGVGSTGAGAGAVAWEDDGGLEVGWGGDGGLEVGLGGGGRVGRPCRKEDEGESALAVATKSPKDSKISITIPA